MLHLASSPHHHTVTMHSPSHTRARIRTAAFHTLGISTPHTSPSSTSEAYPSPSQPSMRPSGSPTATMTSTPSRRSLHAAAAHALQNLEKSLVLHSHLNGEQMAYSKSPATIHSTWSSPSTTSTRTMRAASRNSIISVLSRIVAADPIKANTTKEDEAVARAQARIAAVLSLSSPDSTHSRIRQQQQQERPLPPLPASSSPSRDGTRLLAVQKTPIPTMQQQSLLLTPTLTIPGTPDTALHHGNGAVATPNLGNLIGAFPQPSFPEDLQQRPGDGADTGNEADVDTDAEADGGYAPSFYSCSAGAAGSAASLAMSGSSFGNHSSAQPQADGRIKHLVSRSCGDLQCLATHANDSGQPSFPSSSAATEIQSSGSINKLRGLKRLTLTTRLGLDPAWTPNSTATTTVTTTLTETKPGIPPRSPLRAAHTEVMRDCPSSSSISRGQMADDSVLLGLVESDNCDDGADQTRRNSMPVGRLDGLLVTDGTRKAGGRPQTATDNHACTSAWTASRPSGRPSSRSSNRSMASLSPLHARKLPTDRIFDCTQGGIPYRTSSDTTGEEDQWAAAARARTSVQALGGGGRYAARRAPASVLRSNSASSSLHRQRSASLQAHIDAQAEIGETFGRSRSAMGLGLAAAGADEGDQFARLDPVYAHPQIQAETLGMSSAYARASLPDMLDWRLREEIGRQRELLEEHKAEIRRLSDAVTRLAGLPSRKGKEKETSPALTTASGEREWIADDGSPRTEEQLPRTKTVTVAGANAPPRTTSIARGNDASADVPTNGQQLVDEELLRRARSCDKLARLTGESILASPSLKFGFHERTRSAFSVDSSVGDDTVATANPSRTSWFSNAFKRGSTNNLRDGERSQQQSSEFEESSRSASRLDMGRSSFQRSSIWRESQLRFSRQRSAMDLRTHAMEDDGGATVKPRDGDRRASLLDSMRSMANRFSMKSRPRWSPGGPGEHGLEGDDEDDSDGDDDHVRDDMDDMDHLPWAAQQCHPRRASSRPLSASKTRSVPNLLSFAGARKSQPHQPSPSAWSASPSSVSATSWIAGGRRGSNGSPSRSHSLSHSRNSSLTAASTAATSPPTSPLRGPVPPSAYQFPRSRSSNTKLAAMPVVSEDGSGPTDRRPIKPPVSFAVMGANPLGGGGINEAPIHNQAASRSAGRLGRSLSLKAFAGRV